MTTTNDMKNGARRNYQKATMRVVEMSGEAHLLSGSGSISGSIGGGPSLLHGTAGHWQDFQ